MVETHNRKKFLKRKPRQSFVVNVFYVKYRLECHFSFINQDFCFVVQLLTNSWIVRLIGRYEETFVTCRVVIATKSSCLIRVHQFYHVDIEVNMC